jgi:hypothetical protein
MTRMKRVLLVSWFAFACSSEPPAMDMPAPDDGTGTDVTAPDPSGPDSCLDSDQCPNGDTHTGLPPDPNALKVGSELVTTTYAGFYMSASSASAAIDIPPHGGVADDSLHPYRNPTGVIPPSQSVVLLDVTPKSGFYNVKYESKSGWISTHKLAAVDGQVSQLEFAQRSEVRNAYFKHQIHRNQWNKDGPLHSGNCAPTSLAMAIDVMGKEPAGLSVEQSIHRVRAVYDPGLHESNGTSRADIAQAATKLGMKVLGLNTLLSGDAMLKRLSDQLGLGHVIVLEGEPGNPNTSSPSAYEAAFNAAYADAIKNGASLYHSTYDFNGYHAIVVIGKDAGGHFIVGDPLSEVGFVPLTPAQMKDFFARWGGTGNAVW